MARIEHLPARVTALVFASTATPALAYIDPNVGGQLAQILAPIVTMIIGVVAFARHWLKALLTRTTDRLRALVSRVRD
jgi:hypothetical protein